MMPQRNGLRALEMRITRDQHGRVLLGEVAQSANELSQCVGQRATLIQTAQARYQQLQTDIAGWGSYTTAQKQAATLNTMNAVATTMQIVRLVARIMIRDRT